MPLSRAMSVLILAFCMGCGPSWSEFHSPDGRFAVMVPGAAEEEVGAEATPLCPDGEHEYLFPDGPHLPLMRRLQAIPSGYSVGFCVMAREETDLRSAEPRSFHDDLQLERDALVEAANATLLKSDRIERHGMPMIEYTTTSEEGIESRTRLLVAGGIRYRLVAVGESEREVHSASADRFLESFRVVQD